MKTITQQAYARAGLLGNPSDGYHGKTISIIVKNFSAQVELTSSPKLTIVPGENESHSFDSIDHLSDQISTQGYYGGIRLIKAAIKRFREYCRATGQELHDENFSVSYQSNIPRQVGLAGSSAIVTAMLRGLMDWYGVEIQEHLLASLTLSAELELGIPAGLQDRVIQAYEGVVFMDFAEEKMQEKDGLSFGVYEQLDPRSLPNLYVAYGVDAGEPTEVLHNDLRNRFNSGDSDVVNAMQQFADLAEQGVQAIHHGQTDKLNMLINQNFDLRKAICQLHSEHVRIVQAARRCGASAKYCGSGGAIIGVYTGEPMFEELTASLGTIGCKVVKPIV